MKNKKISLIALGLVLMSAIPVLAGCTTPVIAEGTTTTPVQVSQQPQGIWVSGTGEVTVNPSIGEFLHYRSRNRQPARLFKVWNKVL